MNRKKDLLLNEEFVEFLMHDILPRDEKACTEWLMRYVVAVFTKICIIKNIDSEDREKVEMQARKLSSQIQSKLIDFADYMVEGERK